jgi:signal transduction histidine kinase
MQSLERAEQLVHMSIAQLRDTASDLTPAIPVAGSLADALTALADQAANRGGFRCAVSVQCAVAGVDDEAVIAIVRELLANVVKHASAGNASVAVEPGPADTVKVSVTDDGVGISPGRVNEAAADGHIGLALVAARVRDANGTLKVEPLAGGGTAVIATLSPSG